MTNPFQRAAAAGVEADARIEEARKIEEELRQERQKKRDIDFKISSLEVHLRESLIDFYTLQRASEILGADSRLLTVMIRNGAIFGLKIDGKWYAEKIEVDEKVGLV